MAKLFIQNLPTPEQVHEAVFGLNKEGDVLPLYFNTLYMKVATDIENYTEQVLAPHQLSGGRFMLLFLLRSTPAGLMPSEISQQLGVTQATVSGLINSLEKQELLKRETHQKDGRSFVINITEKGSALIEQIFPQWYPKLAEFWGQFSQEEILALRSLLEKMSKTSVFLTTPK